MCIEAKTATSTSTGALYTTKFKVGDRVKIVKGGDATGGSWHTFEIGQVVTIERIGWEGETRYYAKLGPGRRDTNFFLDHEVASIVEMVNSNGFLAHLVENPTRDAALVYINEAAAKGHFIDAIRDVLNVFQPGTSVAV